MLHTATQESLCFLVSYYSHGQERADLGLELEGVPPLSSQWVTPLIDLDPSTGFPFYTTSNSISLFSHSFTMLTAPFLSLLLGLPLLLPMVPAVISFKFLFKTHFYWHLQKPVNYLSWPAGGRRWLYLFIKKPLTWHGIIKQGTQLTCITVWSLYCYHPPFFLFPLLAVLFQTRL